MKKLSAIFFLTVFCVYSFTYKTHYCFYADTGLRFHGDCQHVEEEAAAKDKITHANFFPELYNCFNLIKKDQVQEAKIIPVNNLSASAFIVPPIIEIPFFQQQVIVWLIPDIQSSSGPSILPSSLRGPPFC